jgi:hypothetical protein
VLWCKRDIKSYTASRLQGLEPFKRPGVHLKEPDANQPIFVCPNCNAEVAGSVKEADAILGISRKEKPDRDLKTVRERITR